MDIDHEEKGRKGTFFIDAAGKRTAELVYFHSVSGKITIYHTEVAEELRGQGIGSQLVKRAVEYAKVNDLKIIPTCPFARKAIEKTPEFRSVLA